MKDFKLLALFGLQAAQEAIAEQIQLVEEAIALDHGTTRGRGRPPNVRVPMLEPSPNGRKSRTPVSAEGKANIKAGQLERSIKYWVDKIQGEGLDPEVALRTSKVRLAVLKRLKGAGYVADVKTEKKQPSEALTEARRRNAAIMRDKRMKQIKARKREAAADSRVLAPKKAAEKRRYHPKDRAKWLANVTKAARDRRDREALAKAKAAMTHATVEAQEQ